MTAKSSELIVLMSLPIRAAPSMPDMYVIFKNTNDHIYTYIHIYIYQYIYTYIDLSYILYLLCNAASGQEFGIPGPI